MFWKKIKSKEYQELYHQIELIKIDIAMLQKRKLKKILPKEAEGGVQEPPFNDGFDEIRRINKGLEP